MHRIRSNMRIKAKSEHIKWYNNYYKREQIDFTPWYRLMLPELIKDIKNDVHLIELGCGQSKGLRFLALNKIIKENNIYGIDQSIEAIKFSQNKLPNANLEVGDIYNLKYKKDSFDYVLLMEVIEHLEHPIKALFEIKRILKPSGKLIISFPNYLNIPWLVVRIMADIFGKHNWINLQPVDKIYTTIEVIRLCNNIGFKLKKCIGSNYFPPIFYKYEIEMITKALNYLKLYHLSFHPILFFIKKG